MVDKKKEGKPKQEKKKTTVDKKKTVNPTVAKKATVKEEQKKRVPLATKPTEKKPPKKTKKKDTKKKGAGDKKITDEELEKDLMYYRGIVSAICQKHHITRSAVWKRIKKSDHLQEVYKDAKELFKDEIESQFVLAVRAGEKWAVEKGIDKLLHTRGYVNKQEIDQTVTNRDEETQKRKEALSHMSANQLKEFKKLQKMQIDFLEAINNKNETQSK